MKRKKNLILEFTEFNNQRFNSDSIRPAMNVDNPSLSINAFDKHEDIVRNAISKIGSLTNALQNTTAYRSLKSKISIDEQDISNVKIIKIVKSNANKYDVYITFIIDKEEYWGVIIDITNSPELKSEVFKDGSLLQTKEWIIKTKGIIIKSIKNWLKPQFGKFKLIKDEVQCYSSNTGKMLILKINSIIEVLKSYDNKIIFEYEGEQYSIINDNFIYFNWWFEPVTEIN